MRVLLTESQFVERLGEQRSAEVICLDADWPEVERESGGDLPQTAGPENAAYVIYTSGSTGRPKGVIVTHSNVARLFSATEEWFKPSPSDCWTLFHSYAFDFSVWELWGALLYGGRLAVVPYWVSRSASDFLRLLEDERVTVLSQTPSAFRQLMAADEARPARLSLREVVFGGEALELQSLAPWVERRGDESPRLVNMYGITETTVHVTFRPIRREDIEAGAGSVIGVPIPDLRLHVFDGRGQLVPTGVTGELHVGGAGLARGYLNRAALTAERFVPDGYGGEVGARLYRTGDTGRRLSDGGLEYAGRIDEQVKIRGFRIELGEVEAALASHPSVGGCVVAAREDEPGEKRLVAYFVARGDAAPQTGELRGFLSERLPDYMVPSAFVEMDGLPLTSNGKVDRRALPAPEYSRPDLEESYVAPRTRVEKELAEVWAEALGVERVGVRDNFFDLGGDSIRSIQVRAKAMRRGLDFTIQQLFQHQTVEALAREVDGGRAASPERTERTEPFALVSEEDRAKLPTDVEDAYPLTRLQMGMLFHSSFELEAAVYHNVATFHVLGPFDESAFREAVSRLVARHPVLRTSFHLTGYSEPLQLVHREVEIEVGVTDLGGLGEREQEEAVGEWFEAEMARRFDWKVAPLIRFQLHRRGPEDFQFSVTEHHAILDGWSVASMFTELFNRYAALVGLRAWDEPPPPATAFSDFVELERRTLQSPEGQEFWAGLLEGAESTRLPRPAAPRGEEGAGEVPRVAVRIPGEVSEGLKRLAQEAGVPVKSVLLAAHLRVLSLLSGRTDVVTGVVANGRPEEEGGEEVLGLFLNTLPFRLRLGGGTWAELARAVFELEREMMPHRRYPLAELRSESGGPRLFDSLFNFTHFHVYQGIQEQAGLRVVSDRGVADTNFPYEADFSLDLNSGAVQLQLGYDAREFSAEQFRHISAYYLRTLAAMAAEPSGRYDTCRLLPDEEWQLLLREWSGAGRSLAVVPGFEELFEGHAAERPDSVAVCDGDERVTYGELNRRANRLARHLRRRGVRPDSLVGVFVERSVEMVVAVAAVLKAGGAYLPLDANYPSERLAYLLKDSGAALVVTREHLLGRLPECDAEVVCVDDAALARERATNPKPAALPDNLAYVIYTSGSTGKPKGVMISRRSLATAFQAWAKDYGLDHSFGHLQMASFSFDVSAGDLTRALWSGARLVLCPQEFLLDPPRLYRLMCEGPTDCGDFVPAVMRGLAQYLEETGRSLDFMRVMAVGSDSFYGSEYATFRRVAGRETRVLNSYGVTEATVDNTFYEGDPANLPPGGIVPIGRPYTGTRMYAFDPHRQPTPVGTAGELHIGGPACARLPERPELTAEKFVPTRSAASRGRGSTARATSRASCPTASIEFLGRAGPSGEDARLPHRARARSRPRSAAHPAVREAWRRARGRRRRQAAGGVRRAERPTADASELRALLRERLPGLHGAVRPSWCSNGCR